MVVINTVQVKTSLGFVVQLLGLMSYEPNCFCVDIYG